MRMFVATNTFVRTIMTAQVQGFEIRARTHKNHRSLFFTRKKICGWSNLPTFFCYFSFLLCASCFFYILVNYKCLWLDKQAKKSGSKTPLNIIINVQVFVRQTCAHTLKGQIWLRSGASTSEDDREIELYDNMFDNFIFNTCCVFVCE